MSPLTAQRAYASTRECHSGQVGLLRAAYDAYPCCCFAGAAASMRMCHGIEAVAAKKRLRDEDVPAPVLSQLPASQPLFTPASSPMSSHQIHSQQMVFKRPADVLATQVDDESTDDEGVTV